MSSAAQTAVAPSDFGGKSAGTVRRPRGRLVRRALLAADVLGLWLAFVAAELVFSLRWGGLDHFDVRTESFLFLLTLPGWIAAAKIYGLYDHDEERADHSTVDDLVGVLHVLTMGAWAFFLGAKATELVEPSLVQVAVFWAAAIALLTTLRALARSLCRRSPDYLQNTVVVGAGDVGQLLARKIRQHPEYGIRLLGFVDGSPRPLRADVADVPLLGDADHLPELVDRLGVERVVVAFSEEAHDRTIDLVRRLKALDVQVDIVPRLYEVVGPNVGLHALEGVPLVALPTMKRFPGSGAIKRGIDIVGASIGLLLTAPLLAAIALLIRRDSPGPALFRQTRVGHHRQEFTMLKFRTMRTDTDDSAHRDFIKNTMSASATTTGLYKLSRDDAVTGLGRFLRRTSLDELPQLWNVLRGEMSLVGPRPCLAYETEHFAPHHFERFLVVPGLTGLWQVTARAHSTFGEALDMDVAYARGWSLGLDLWLLLKTPFHLKRGTA